jgi:hypothetical protein
MLAVLEARRDKSIRRIAEYRESFAGRVRASADRIINAEPASSDHRMAGDAESAIKPACASTVDGNFGRTLVGQMTPIDYSDDCLMDNYAG